MIKKIIPICIFFTSLALADADTENTEPSSKKTGNFANDRSPGTSFGFGQYILDEGNTAFYLYIDQSKGKKQSEITLYPLVAYGIADYLSVFCSIPLVTSCYSDGKKSRGIGDVITQFEYVYWQPSTKHIDGWATLVGNITFPTASTPHDESLGLGTPSFFLGSTLSILSTKWYAYAEGGATLIPASYKCTRTGNCFLYEWGAGYNLLGKNNTILALLIDFNGIYTKKDKDNMGVSDPNSGGNILYIGPTLFYSHKSLVLTFGIQGPAVQHLNGTQNKQYYRTLFAGSISF